MTDALQTTTTDISRNAFADELHAEYVDKTALCAGLGISTRTLDRMEVARTGPPKTKIGKRVLYRKDSVRSWLASNEQERPRSTRRRTFSNSQ
jgi:predicted DNA-binding transcriptional regulator AlpA